MDALVCGECVRAVRLSVANACVLRVRLSVAHQCVRCVHRLCAVLGEAQFGAGKRVAVRCRCRRQNFLDPGTPVIFRTEQHPVAVGAEPVSSCPSARGWVGTFVWSCVSVWIFVYVCTSSCVRACVYSWVYMRICMYMCTSYLCACVCVSEKGRTREGDKPFGD